MPLPILRYALDPTGVNPDNHIVGEIHTLTTNLIRAVAPTYGPIYTDRLAVYDNSSNRLLVRGVDYHVVELLQEATAKYGLEIAELILIVNTDISSQIRLDYQVLGGLYQNNSAGVINMYETWLLDNRPVDWSNVLNTPLAFPPTLHNHLLQDIYGFEPVVVALERIRNAIVLSDVPAFEALIEWVRSQTRVVTEQQIVDSQPTTNLVTFERLLFALDQLNFNGITVNVDSTNVLQGAQVQIQVSATNIPDNHALYWTIEHLTTELDDFSVLAGIINLTDGRGVGLIPIALNGYAESLEQFRVEIRKNGVAGPILTRSPIITIGEHGGNPLIDYFTACCMFNPDVGINADSLYILDFNSHPNSRIKYE